jgi:hypothetical protein
MTAIDLLGPASASGAVTVRPGDARTFGITDSWFRDCTDPDTDDGTAYEAAFFNAVLANLRSVVRGNGQTAASADIVAQDNAADDLIWRACQHLYQRGQPAWAVDSSVTPNQIIVSLTPAAAELKAGMRVRVKIAQNNTGATTMTVNSQNANVKTIAGQDLQKGMLIAGQIALFAFDGTNWQMISIFSEKVVFTPRATINLSAIGSIPFNTWTQHSLSAGSAANMVPTVGSSSFQLPDGTYLFIIKGSTTIGHVINQTQIAHQIRLIQNGTQVAAEFEASELIAGADLTTYRNLVCTAQVVASDVLAVQSWIGTTFLADYPGGSAGTGTIDIVRLGN